MHRFRETALKTTAGIGIIAALLFPAVFATAQELVTLLPRDGVTQSFLLDTPSNPPSAVAVLFPGGAGNISLRTEGGQIKLREGNFLVRSRIFFVDGGLATAVMDAPSDQATGMDDRHQPRHNFGRRGGTDTRRPHSRRRVDLDLVQRRALGAGIERL